MIRSRYLYSGRGIYPLIVRLPHGDSSVTFYNRDVEGRRGDELMCGDFVVGTTMQTYSIISRDNSDYPRLKFKAIPVFPSRFNTGFARIDMESNLWMAVYMRYPEGGRKKCEN